MLIQDPIVCVVFEFKPSEGTIRYRYPKKYRFDLTFPVSEKSIFEVYIPFCRLISVRGGWVHKRITLQNRIYCRTKGICIYI